MGISDHLENESRVMRQKSWQWLCWHAQKTYYSNEVDLSTMIILTCPQNS